MPPDLDLAPDDPREWLRIAREDLALSKAQVTGVGYGLLCFHAQQAAEKATKAVLMHHKIGFPYVHDIGLLIQLARKGGVVVPEDVMDADILTDYATIGRYPGHRELEESDHAQATPLRQP